MLGKPKQIFISYGARRHPKTDFVIECIIDEITTLKTIGYRIEHRLIDENYWISENGEIQTTVRDEMDRADGAIIILTPSDVGGNAEHRSQAEKLQPRARQNVIHEYGFLQARLQHRCIKVFADTDIEVPSNLISFARSLLPMSILDDASPASPNNAAQRDNLKRQIQAHTRALAVTTMEAALIRKNPLFDSAWKINLADFVQSRTSTREAHIAFEWKTLFDDVVDAHERILLCYERIVFDPYLFKLDIWQSQIERIERDLPSDTLAVALIKGISLVRRYQEGAARETDAGSNLVRILVGAELDELLDGLNDVSKFVANIDDIAPIVRIVLHDYLGLCQLRRAREIAQEPLRQWSMQKRRDNRTSSAAWLERAIASLDRASSLAEEFESESQPVWQAFALFNLARAQRERSDISGGSDHDWRRTLDKSIIRRNRLCGDGINVPEIVRMGFMAEHLHACLYKVSTSPRGTGRELLDTCFPRYEELRGWQGPQFPLRKDVEAKFAAAIRRR